MLRKISLGIVLIVVLAVGLSAQDVSSETHLAFERDGALYVLEPGSDRPVVIDDSRQDGYSAVWSSDGTMLAYLARTESPGHTSDSLKVWDGTQSIDVVTFDKGNEIPLNWTADSQILYISSPVAEEPNFEDEFVYQPVSGQAYTVSPIAHGRPRMIGQVPVCYQAGVSFGDISRKAYNRDMPATLIQLTDVGLIYAADCLDYREDMQVYEGYNGVLFQPSDQELVTLKYGLFEPQILSADQKHLIGYLYGLKGELELTDIDLTTLEDTVYRQKIYPRKLADDYHPVHGKLNFPLALDDEGRLYYTFEFEEGDLLGREQNLALALPLRPYGYMMNVYNYKPDKDTVYIPYNTVGIYRMTADKSELLFEGLDAYEIERMQIVGSMLYFSVTNNSYSLRQDLEDGTLVLNPDENDENLRVILEPYVETDVYAIDLSSPAPIPTLIVKNAHHFAAGQP